MNSPKTRDPREQARARLRPGNFQGHAPRAGSHRTESEAIEALGAAEGRWFESARYRRRARVTSVAALTSTGTVKVGFEVVDGAPFHFDPGQFVGIEAHFEGLGYRRSPYCILSAPTNEPVFELLIRVVPQGPLSQRLASLRPGDEVAFRGPTGRSMVPPDDDRALELFATGTGVAPFCSLARHLLAGGYAQPIRLWWGLRLAEDICLTDELDALASAHRNFSYHITLSQPGAAWTGLRGRIGDSVPPQLATLGGRRYYLAGNGAMLEEMALALSDIGVDHRYIYKEPFFNGTHEADPQVIAEIRERFVADDLFSAYANRRGTGFGVDLDAARSGKAGNGDPLAVSDLFDLMPAFLSHHPDQEDPRPVQSKGSWGRN
jgi:CDP-4-dehydro-6-deoxyglucose reductase/ferredoxin-NAD(P)+ reductase (naphthalene dioxygenase ferredoxin-specific)